MLLIKETFCKHRFVSLCIPKEENYVTVLPVLKSFFRRIPVWCLFSAHGKKKPKISQTKKVKTVQRFFNANFQKCLDKLKKEKKKYLTAHSVQC